MRSSTITKPERQPREPINTSPKTAFPYFCRIGDSGARIESNQRESKSQSREDTYAESQDSPADPGRKPGNPAIPKMSLLSRPFPVFAPEAELLGITVANFLGPWCSRHSPKAFTPPTTRGSLTQRRQDHLSLSHRSPSEGWPRSCLRRYAPGHASDPSSRRDSPTALE